VTGLGTSLLTSDGGEQESTNDWAMWGVQCLYIGRRITELLCQTKVDEEGDRRRAINEYHEVCWLDVTMDVVVTFWTNFFFPLSTFPRSKLLTYSFPPSCDPFPFLLSYDLLMTHPYYL